MHYRAVPISCDDLTYLISVSTIVHATDKVKTIFHSRDDKIQLTRE
jgi:hypothetical protein